MIQTGSRSQQGQMPEIFSLRKPSFLFERHKQECIYNEYWYTCGANVGKSMASYIDNLNHAYISNNHAPANNVVNTEVIQTEKYASIIYKVYISGIRFSTRLYCWWMRHRS